MALTYAVPGLLYVDVGSQVLNIHFASSSSIFFRQLRSPSGFNDFFCAKFGCEKQRWC